MQAGSARFPLWLALGALAWTTALWAVDSVAPQKVTASGTAFGTSVAISGDTMVVGAPDTTGGGAAYVYTRADNKWTQSATLTRPAPASKFGASVAISGSTIVVGDPTTNSNQGAAYVFTGSGTAWGAPTSLPLPELAKGFGTSIAVAGTRIVIGAPTSDYRQTGGQIVAQCGAVYVFDYISGAWSLFYGFNPGNATSQFGAAVALNGALLAVGSPNCFGKGSVFVYSLDSPSSGPTQIDWTQSSGAKFGASVAWNGTTLLMGMPDYDVVGYVLIMPQTGSTWSWADLAVLTQPDQPTPRETARFGAGLALDGSLLVVAAPATSSSTLTGAAYVYTGSGKTWSLMQKLSRAKSDESGNLLGQSVAVSSDMVLAGAPTAASGSGATYYWLSGCGFGHDIVKGQWAMFTTSCNSAATVGDLARALPAGSVYGTNWNVFKKVYLAGGGSAYESLAGTSTALEQGTGYWFKTLVDPVSVPVIAQQPLSLTTSTSCPTGCFEIALRKPVNVGATLFNLVGNPFPYDVSWANVRIQVTNGSTTSVYTPAQAAGSGSSGNASPAVLTDSIWLWNGSNYQPYNSGTAGALGTLRPGSAFWVQVLDWNSSDSVKLLVSPPGGMLLRAFALPAGSLGAGEWYARLKIEVAAEHLKATDKLLGQLNASVAGYDKNDLAAMAPTFTPYLTLVFPHPEWGAKAGDYAVDYRAVRAGSDNWSFQVQTDKAGRQVTLSWETAGAAPQNMTLLDTLTGKVIPVQTGSYTFTMTSATRNFTWRAFNWPAR